MISKPLFRNGDCVHPRQDLYVGRRYDMVHQTHTFVVNNERLNAMINVVCPEYGGCLPFHVLNHGSYRQMLYEVDGWFIVDDMLVEGHRIMQYLN